MSRGRKIAVWIAGVIVGLVILVVVAAFVIVQTSWFREFVREKIISETETATGGKVDLGSFSFSPSRLRAEIRNFVIHGTEPPNAPPLFRAQRIELVLKLTSPLEHFVDIHSLVVDAPQANVIVYPNGTTNIPSPKIKHTSNKTGLETIVDLAIGRFNLNNGSFTFAERKMPLNASGKNLRAQLFYTPAPPGYKGELTLEPLVAQSGANPPVNITVTLPVELGRDKVQLNNAKIATPESQILVSGTMDHLVNPRVSAHLNARLALEEVRRLAGVAIHTTGNLPRYLNADVSASMGDNRIQISRAHLDLGRSDLEASGTFQDPRRPSGLRFNARLALGELGKLFGFAPPTAETVQLAGIGRSTGPSDYRVDDLRLSALGGSLTGDAALENSSQFRLNGRLDHFEIATITRALMAKPLPYQGTISGPIEARGDIHRTSEMAANARLVITPGRRGVPVAGRLNAGYDPRAGTVALDHSYVALPHSRLDLSGTLGSRVDVRLVSRNLSDFQPAVGSPLPVRLNQGAVTFTGAVTGKLSAPRITGHLAANNFAVEDKAFNQLAADLNLSPAGATLRNGMLARAPMQITFSAAVGMEHWKPRPRDPLSANLAVNNADVSDVLALAGQKDIPATGALTASARISGTVGDPRGSASLNVAHGTAYQEPFDQLTAQVNLTGRSIDLPDLRLTAGSARVDLNASYQHPRNDLRQGVIRAHLASNSVELQQFQTLQKQRPGLAGTVQLLADVIATVQPAAGEEKVQLASVNGNLSARGLRIEGNSLGDLTASAETAGSQVNYRLDSNFAGSNIRVNGQSQLAGDHATTANAGIRGLPIQQVLAVAGRSDIQAAGTLDASASFNGTLADPHVKANLTVVKGVVEQEPFDRLEASADYSKALANLATFRVTAGPNWIEASGSFAPAQPSGNEPFRDGRLRFHVASNRIQLARIHYVQLKQPNLAGSLELKADGEGTLKAGTPLFSSLNARLAATGVTVNHKPVGDLTATANTTGADLVASLTSNFAGAAIKGDGRVTLRGDYPTTARLSFAHITYTGLRPLLGAIERPGFDALVEGDVSVNGPAAKPENLQGTLRLSRLEVNASPQQTGLARNTFTETKAAPPARRTANLHNDGPIVVTLQHSTIQVQSARITGTDANLNLTGSALLRDPKTVNLHAAGNVKLEIVQAFDPDVFSTGAVTLDAAVRGTTDKPLVNGKLQLQNASFNEINAPNGLSNANGVIVFNGDHAVIQNLTGETGGGKIVVTGSVVYGGPEMQLHVQAAAHSIRIQEPEGITTQASANLNLNGSTRRSLLGGNVTIEEVAMHSHTDIGSMLSQTATPPAPPQTSTGLLAGMRFDVRIDTAPNVRFRTSLAQNLQADAHLRLRGSPNRPGMLGRLNTTGGQIVFFGTQYTIDRGTVSFFNPQKIEPVIDIDLQTTVQGVNVVLAVSGPADRLKLTYHSDPPMQFSDIVTLLATGKVNTTDPVLASRQPPPPQQTLPQKGASALLGQAVANPVSSRLQRLFGVSKLKIDPQLIGAQNTPTARLTLQQQITKKLTFTYIEDITGSNPQIIRVQWDVNPIWTAILERQENGEVGLDIFYKKHIQ